MMTVSWAERTEKRERCTPLVREMKAEGKSLRDIAAFFGSHPETIRKWLYTASQEPFRIEWSSAGNCFHIWELDPDWTPNPDPTSHSYRCLRWMRFATVDAAEQHIELYLAKL